MSTDPSGESARFAKEYGTLINDFWKDYASTPYHIATMCLRMPASTMVEVSKFTSPEYLIEMNAIAVLA